MAAQFQDGSITLWKVSREGLTQEAHWAAQEDEPVKITFTPDGSSFVSASKSSLKVWELASLLSPTSGGGAPEPLLHKSAFCHPLSDVSISPKGALILWCCVKGCLEILSLRSGSVHPLWRLESRSDCGFLLIESGAY